MAKKKKQKPEPYIRPGILLDMEHLEIPPEWMPVDDYSSHRPMLYRAIMNIPHSVFSEFGTGKGSTPFLKALYACEFPEKELMSYENDYQWYDLMRSPSEYETDYFNKDSAFSGNHHLVYAHNLLTWNIWMDSIAFVDCKPGELRKHLISKHSSTTQAIIVHDTEPGAEYVYGMSGILESFKFRCDLVVEGSPQTTIVSNIYDFSNWKTVVNEKIQFI